MNETSAIVEAFEQSEREGKRAVLATVMRTSGSVYRREGARMLVTLDLDGGCSITGAISGGCLERDVCARAREVLRTGARTIVKYDTTSDDDIVWGLGLGCNGVVEVLLEPLAPLASESSEPSVSPSGIHPVAFLARCLERRERSVMATVLETSGATGARVGERLISYTDETVKSDITDDELLESVLEDVRTTMREGRSHVREYDFETGRAVVFIETIEPPVPFVLFGAGADAVPVARLAHELGWHVTIVDHRAAFATPSRFPAADTIIVCRPERVAEQVTLDERTVAVLMTHNYEHDRELLKALLASPVRYIGCLGPAKRTARMLSELFAEGVAPTDEELARVYAPIGLDIGAETPEEIALSIAAEIRTTLSGHAGGSLRVRKGAIHGETCVKSGSRELREQFDVPVSGGVIGSLAVVMNNK